MLKLIFNDQPGMHERHLRRKVNNPLFVDSTMSQQDILAAREHDERELEAFMQDFHGLARDASALDASADSEVLLALKARLDQCYERCCGQMGKHDEIRQGLTNLIDAIMAAVIRASASDRHALDKLEDEIAARKQHFAMLQYPLIVDMLRPDSPLTAEDLIPSLLSANEEDALAAAALFTHEQRVLMCQQGQALLERVAEAGGEVTAARRILDLIRQLD
jgi:hypothetical protein